MYTFLRFCFLEKLFLGNKISKDELEAAEKVANLSVSRKLGDFFDQLDTDIDGFISKDELEAAQKNVSSQLDFYEFDRDWGGNISKEFGETAASASLHNVDQVLNECCIERILSESAEHTKKMQKSNDATKKHADANKLLNESIAIRRNAYTRFYKLDIFVLGLYLGLTPAEQRNTIKLLLWATVGTTRRRRSTLRCSMLSRLRRV